MVSAFCTASAKVLLIVTVDVTYLCAFSGSIFPHCLIPSMLITPPERSEVQRTDCAVVLGLVIVLHMTLLLLD